ncbi:glycosyltransferase [Tamlana flava]|uniref:glycosyltransferase n=1 Tax=Tamlana flava TaxID=3158572 RepID=UPI00351BA951
MKPNEVICLTPVFNDWESLSILLSDIEKQAALNNEYKFRAIVINDGSTEPMTKKILEKNIDVEVINLKLNIGHQRAIAVGLQYISNEIVKELKIKGISGHVVVLDGDGEDKPSDIMSMVQKANNEIVFAKRVKRSEGIRFKIGYYFYKLIFKLLTGKAINYGNFSAIPFSLIKNVALLPNIWNHYAGSIVESRIKFSSYPTERGNRYAGKSKMNTMNLIIHGFSSISIYFDRLCFRVLKFSFISILLCSALISFVLYSRLFTDNAIPGWASSLILIALSIVVQLFSVTFIILLFQLSTRRAISPPNKKLYLDFINREKHG